MSISIKRYVDITSAVGGGAAVAQRDLVGRIFSDNVKTPADAIVEFDLASDVGVYYGTTSEEYKRALFYFGWISKAVTSPKKLQFARFAKTAAPANIFGAAPGPTLAQLNAITAGTLNITVGGQIANPVSINLSASGSLAAVATALQTAIRSAAGSQFATALVAYDPVAGVFNFTATTAGAAAISVGVTPLMTLLGWNTGVLSPGVSITSITAALDASLAISNNFGSFGFVPTLSTQETIDAATWNNAQGVNFIGCFETDAASAASLSPAIIGFEGAALTLSPLPAEYPELVPMLILAATDYSRRNSVQNYMYQQFPLTPAVSSNSGADTYDALRVNYYGNTQTAGQQINFYQRGTLMGGATAPIDMNTYANEMWFKDAAQSAIMALLLALPRIPANVEGRGQVLTILQDVIERALFNGTISVGKTLTSQQRVFITNASGDDKAWFQVQSIGYWVDCVIVSYTGPSNTTEYKAVYTLIYSKDDAIRKVEGSQILI